MNNKPLGNKRIGTNSPNRMLSPHKAQKREQNQSVQMAVSSPQQGCSATSIDSKMNNIAKLRQQFVEEFKDVELSLKETIKSLKYKISETKKKGNTITEMLRKENELLCNQGEIIYNKERENRVLREQVEELYEYQKTMFGSIEDISSTLNKYFNSKDQLMREYESMIIIEDDNIIMLEEELKKITADEELCKKLEGINLKISELEKQNNQYQNEISFLESKIKSKKLEREEQEQQSKELDKKMNELETRNNNLIQNANKRKNNLINEIEELKKQNDTMLAEGAKLEEHISELKVKLETNRNNENELDKKINDINNKIHLLLKENKELDESSYKQNQENTITLEKLKEHLQVSQAELESVKEKENQATSVLEKKISELRIKLKSYESVDSKLKQFEAEIKKQEDFKLQLEAKKQDYEKKKNQSDEKIKLNNDKVTEIKAKINKGENDLRLTEEKIKLFETEIRELNIKLEAKLKAIKESDSNVFLSTQSITNYHLPDLALEEAANSEKQKNRKKLYTPQLADDDLEIDAMPLEDQVQYLTQSRSLTVGNDPESPDKTRKFFKHSLSQTKVRKENTPRGKGRARKH